MEGSSLLSNDDEALRICVRSRPVIGIKPCRPRGPPLLGRSLSTLRSDLAASNPKMTPRTVTLTVQAQATFQDSEKTQHNKETCSNEVTPGDLRTHRHCLYEFRNNVKTRAPLEIRQLNADLLDIDSQFQQISTELLKFDAEAFVDNKQEALELHPTWKSHHEVCCRVRL